MTVALSSLRVTADMDVSGYTRGMQQLAAASQGGVASVNALGSALAAQDAAAGKAAGIANLSRTYITGYSDAQKFESAIRSVSNWLGRAGGDTASLERAGVLIDNIVRKFGMVPNAAELAKQGFVNIVPVIDQVTAHYQEQAAQLELVAERSRQAIAVQHQMTPQQAGTANALGVSSFEQIGPALDNLRSKYDLVYAAEQKHRAEVQQINADQMIYAKGTGDSAGAQMIFGRALQESEARLHLTKTALGGAQTGARLTAGEFTNLSFQLNDIATGLALGQPLWMIFAQQGGQVYQVLQTSGAAAKGWGNALTAAFNSVKGVVASVLTGVVGAIAAVAVAVAGAVYSFSSFLTEGQALQVALGGIGRASGSTVASLRQVGQEVATWNGLSVSQATEVAAEFARVGTVAIENIAPATKQVRDLAATLGVDATEAAKTFADALANGGAGAETLNKKLGFLSDASRQRITDLRAQGKWAEAERVIIDGVASSTLKAAEVTGFWAASWNAVTNVTSNLSHGLGSMLSSLTGVGKSIEEQIADLEKLNKASDNISFGGLFSMGGEQQAFDNNLKKIDELKKKLDESAAAAAKVRENILSIQMAETVRRLAPEVTARSTAENDVTTLRRMRDEMIAIMNVSAFDPKVLESFNNALGRAETHLQNVIKLQVQWTLEQQRIQYQSITAFSPSAKGEIAYQSEKLRLLQQNIDITKKETQEQIEGAKVAGQARVNAVKEATTALSEAQRERVLAAQQSVAGAKIEIDMIGKSVGEQYRLQAVEQARAQLEQEAARNRTGFDQKKLDALTKEIEKTATLKQLAAIKSLQNQTDFTSQTMFFSPEDLRVAQAMSNIFGKEWPNHMRDNLALQIKFNDLMGQTRDAAQDFAKTFVHGLLEGKSATEALSSAVKGLANKILDKSIDQIVNQAMSALTGAAIGGGTQVAGATTAASVWTEAGITFNASLIAAATSAAGILGVGGVEAGTGVATGSATGAATMTFGADEAGMIIGVSGDVAGTAIATGGMAAAAALIAASGPFILIALAVAAVVAGINALVGHSNAKKKAEEEQAKAAKAWADSKDAAVAWMAVMNGGSAGTLGPAIAQQLSQYRQFAETAHTARDDASVLQLQASFNTFVTRTLNDFRNSWWQTIHSFIDGMGPDGPFAKGAKQITDLGDSLKGFIADTQFALGTMPGLMGIAQLATQTYALSLLQIPKPISEIQTAVLSLQGKASELQGVLVSLGMSATEAANAIQHGVNQALADLAAKFQTDLTSQLNDATGKDYLNSVQDIITNILAMGGDAIALGQDLNPVRALADAQVQKVINDSHLTGAAFDELIARFPVMAGRVHAFSAELDAEFLSQRTLALSDRLFNATNDNSTLAGALAAEERQFQREREDEQVAGGLRMTELIAAQQAEQYNLVKSFADKAADTLRQAFDDAQTFIINFRRTITDFVNHWNAGTQSGLSPQDRLTAAQGAFNAQRAIATGSDPVAAREALNSITQYFSDLAEASKAYYGSSVAGQSITGTALNQLTALPNAISPEQLIVNAIQTQTTDLGAQSSLVRLAVNAVTGALGGGGPGSVAFSLAGYFNTLDTNTDGLITSAEMKAVFTDAQVAQILQTLNVDNTTASATGLSRLDLIRIAAQQTGTNTGTTVTNTGTTVTNTGTTGTNTATIAAQALQIATNTLNTTNSIVTQNQIINNTLLGIYDRLGTTGSIYQALTGFGLVPFNAQVFTGTGSTGNASLSPITLSNQMLVAMNKIAWNTAATAYNTSQINLINHAPWQQGLFASGGWTGDGPVGSLAGQVHGQEIVVNAWSARRLADTLNRGVWPANDNGSSSTRLEDKIDQLIAVLRQGVRDLATTDANGAAMLGEKIDVLIDSAEDDTRRQRRRAA